MLSVKLTQLIVQASTHSEESVIYRYLILWPNAGETSQSDTCMHDYGRYCFWFEWAWFLIFVGVVSDLSGCGFWFEWAWFLIWVGVVSHFYGRGYWFEWVWFLIWVGVISYSSGCCWFGECQAGFFGAQRSRIIFCVMSARHIGQFSRGSQHCWQQQTCPHGKNTILVWNETQI